MDRLSLLRGLPLKINDYITLRQPSLGEIESFGEEKYLITVQRFCATAFDFILPLTKIGLDFTEVSDFQLFLLLYPNMSMEETSILLGDLDLSKFSPDVNKQNGETILVNSSSGAVIDAAIHRQLVMNIQEMNGLPHVHKRAGNEHTKEYLIDRERRRASRHKNHKPKFESVLSPLISGLCNSGMSQCDYKTVWDMPIYAFYDSIKRIQKMKMTDHLYSGIYAGSIDPKKISSKDLEFFGDF